MQINQNFIRNLIPNLEDKSAGCLTTPSYTDNGNGTIDVASVDVAIYDNSAFLGVPHRYTLAALDDQALTNNTLNYVVADYNSGTPILKVITNVDLITESEVVPVFTIYRSGNYLHTINWDSLGKGLTNKIHQSIVKTQRYRREYGLGISETGTRNVSIEAGKVWIGANPITVDAINSATDNIFFFYHVAGVWTLSTTPTTYNNTQYDNGTALATLTAGRYAVNWFYRGIENQKHLYSILGTGDYTLQQAIDAVVPTPPTAISSHAVLVGKIIVQKNAVTAYSVQSAFEKSFSVGLTEGHNDLTNRDVAGNHAKLVPLADSTTAIQITKANGTDVVLNFDTTNNYCNLTTAKLELKTLLDNPIVKFEDQVVTFSNNTAIKPTVNGVNTLFVAQTDGTAFVSFDSSNKFVGLGVTDPDEQLEMTGRFHLGQTTAPGTTTDKLYNVSGTLYWNGIDLTNGSSKWTDAGAYLSPTNDESILLDADAYLRWGGNLGLYVYNGLCYSANVYKDGVDEKRIGTAAAHKVEITSRYLYNMKAISDDADTIITWDVYKYESPAEYTIIKGKDASALTGILYGAEVTNMSYTGISDGAAMKCENMLFKDTTDAAATVLLVHGFENYEIRGRTLVTFEIMVNAFSDTYYAKAWKIIGCIKRDASNATAIVGTPSITVIADDGHADITTATVSSITADNTNEYLLVNIAGITDKNIRWSATIRTNETSWTTA